MLNSVDVVHKKTLLIHEQVAPVIYKDVDETLLLLKDIPDLTSNISSTIQNVLKKVRNDELGTAKGLSFLDLKNYALLNYMMNINYVILKKLSGTSIENDPAIDRLVELRIVLERMKPIDEKLRYQVDKLLSAVEHGNFDESNPLRFRANPENLSMEDENEVSIKESKVHDPLKTAAASIEESIIKGSKKRRSEEGETSREERRSNAYVPPKISAAYFDKDMTLEERKKKILQRSKKRAFSNSILHELRNEYDTGPEEIKETLDPHKKELNEKIKDRTRYEEENLTRLTLTKKHRYETQQFTTVTNFNLNLGNISALDMEADNVSLKRRSSGKKGKFSRKAGKKKGKKRKY